MTFAPEQFTRNPATVTAVLLTVDNVGQVAAWCNGEVVENDASVVVGIDIWSDDGAMRAQVGDWVIQDGAFFFPCGPGLFAKDYEAVT